MKALAFLVLGIGLGGQLHAHYCGSVRVMHNINEGTWLNHGQPTLLVQMPAGVNGGEFYNASVVSYGLDSLSIGEPITRAAP